MDSKIKDLEEKVKEMRSEYEQTIKKLEQKLKDNDERIFNILENQRMMAITLVSSGVGKSMTYSNSMKKLVDNS